MQPSPYAHDGKWYIVTHYRDDVPDGRTVKANERRLPPKIWSHDRKKWMTEFAMATAFNTEVEVWNHLNAHDIPRA